MATKKIAVEKAEANFKELLGLVREGTEIILMEGDTPLARLTPAGAELRIPDVDPSGWVSADFDSALSDKYWVGEQ